MFAKFVSSVLNIFFEPAPHLTGNPTPFWASAEAVAHRNYINGAISLVALIIGISFLIAALQCRKKYHQTILNRYLILTVLLFLLAIVCFSVPVFAHFFPFFFTGFFTPSLFGIGGSVGPVTK